MNTYKLANIWCSGDLPFRPRYIAKRFVMDRVKDDPIRTAWLVLDLQRHGPSVAESFLLHLEQYRANPFKWRWHEEFKQP